MRAFLLFNYERLALMTIDQSLFLKHSSSQTIPTEPELHLGPAPSLENVTPPPPKKSKFNIGDEANKRKDRDT